MSPDEGVESRDDDGSVRTMVPSSPVRKVDRDALSALCFLYASVAPWRAPRHAPAATAPAAVAPAATSFILPDKPALPLSPRVCAAASTPGEAPVPPALMVPRQPPVS